MAFDRWDWHYDDVHKAGLHDEAGGTHIGMFVAWLYSAGLLGEFHLEEDSASVEELRQRKLTPGQWFIRYCDGKLWDQDIDETALPFVQEYYGEKARYFDDYANAFESVLGKGRKARSVYSVPDTWASIETLKPILDLRWAEWRARSA